jgi:hypothetical protein
MAYLTRLTVTSTYASGVLPALLIMGLGFGMITAPGHQHCHRRLRARGLRRRLRAGEHHAEGRRLAELMNAATAPPQRRPPPPWLRPP